MFKNFEPINKAVGSTAKTETAFNIERCLSAGSSIISIAKNLPQKYARGYSQVQWMKYSSEGEPSDVTPDEQTSAANSVISEAKSDVQDLLNSYNELDPIHVVRQATPVSLDCLISGTGFNYSHRVQFVLVNGELKLNIINGSAATKHLITNRAGFTSPLVIKNTTQEQQISFYGARVTEGVAVCSDGSFVRYLAGKTSETSDGIISIICEMNGTYYLFQFTDVSHTSVYQLGPMRNITPSPYDVDVKNPTSLTNFGLFALFMAYGHPLVDNDSITQNQGSTGYVYYTMVDASTATNVEVDIALQPEDLYQGLNEVINAIGSL